MGKQKIKALRELAVHEQGGRCAYCGQPMSQAAECLPTSETADHVVPASLGGRTTRANIVAACRDCNMRKGSGSMQVPEGEQRETFGPQRGLGEEPW
jgi:5-methylcytosine-specific restriction endonuclease McrA